MKEMRIEIIKAPSLDLTSSLTRDLTRQTYECKVCFDHIQSRQSIWSCQTCFSTFHLTCVNDWYHKSAKPERDSDRLVWRCPGKVKDPSMKRVGVPHGCGQPCLKPRSCTHPCSLKCHPGPCPPCDALTPPTPCHCGREQFVVKCASVSDTCKSISCGRKCEKTLNCGRHSCAKECHDGPCSPCQEQLDEYCECGQTHRTIQCGTFESVLCSKECGFTFNCGIHSCHRICHAHDDESKESTCPFDPSLILSCHCGKYSLSSLGVKRFSCSDPIPSCKEICSKSLPCGHTCLQSCHEGPCPSCQQTIHCRCRCGVEELNLPCTALVKDSYGEALCSNPCKKMNHCKRHRCTRPCCVMDIHICERVCGKPLTCGQHQCMLPCGHPNRCHDCVEGVGFDEIYCACGKTKMLPPIPCNTLSPICHYPCRKSLPCGHVSLRRHDCHPDSIPCPPCMTFIKKKCFCGKTTRSDFPCSRQGAPSCGSPCSGILDTCGHPCKRFCHSGECTDVACAWTCSKVRSYCGHVCGYKCHGTKACPQDRPCQARLSLVCPCGNRKSILVCGACQSQPLSTKASSMTLECNQECERIARNKRLADALQIESATLSVTHYEPELLMFAKSNMEWVLQIHGIISQFIKNTSLKHYYFPQKLSFAKNQFLVSLARHYNLFAEHVDVQIKKGTVIYRKKNEDPCFPLVLISVAASSYDPDAPIDKECDDEQGTSSKLSCSLPMNAVYFSGFQLGVESSNVSNYISSVFGTELEYTLKTLNKEQDCVIQFKSKGSVYMNPKQLETMIIESIVPQVSYKFSSFIKNIQACHVTLKGEFKYLPRPKQSQVLQEESTIRMFNAFESLES